MWTLLLNRYVLGGLAIAALIGFLAYQKHGYDNRLRAEGAAPYIAAIEKQKVEAQTLLDSEIAKNTALSKQWAEYARKADDDYAKQVADIRARGNAARGVRLYDKPQRGESDCGSTPRDSGAGFAETPSANNRRISDEAAKFLLDQATLADEVAAYAMSCYRFVNQGSIRNQLRSIRGNGGK